MRLAQERAENLPQQPKTDRLRSYREAAPRAFLTRRVKHVVSQGIRAEINNNLSERLQGTIRDRDKTLRALKQLEIWQAYLDGLLLQNNYFRPHESLDGNLSAEAAGAELPFKDREDVAAIEIRYNGSKYNFRRLESYSIYHFKQVHLRRIRRLSLRGVGQS